MPQLINVATNKINDDLTKYMFRQKTLELLFKVKSIDDKLEEKLFKDELKVFFKTMRMYMKANDLRQDKFLINLCDDISIMYHSIGTQLGMMYTTARQTSQGRQHTYTSTPTSKKNREDGMNDDGNHFDDQLLTMKLTPAKLTRSHAIGKTDVFNTFHTHSPAKLLRTHTMGKTNDLDNIDTLFNSSNIITETFNNEDDCDIDKYRISNIITSCYATPSSVNTMTQVSQF
jgi:hypothetical protein